MPSLTVVQVSNTLPTESELKAIFDGAGMRALTDMIAKDMGDAMRGNMLKRGGPGGDWAQLSGYKKGGSKREVNKERRAGNQMASTHTGYAKRKDLGKTPGAGANGADIRLRDTGDLYAGLDGIAKPVTGGWVVEATATGTSSGRDISNAELLAAHANGDGKLPKRDPTEDMSAFEKRTGARIKSYILAMLKRQKP